jgi:SAM-dependent methyltransferase
MTRLRQLAFACSVTALTLTTALVQTALAQTAPTSPAKPAEAYTYTPESGQPGKDVVWVPTQQSLVDGMLDMAQVTKEDYVIDLGSGDGRTVITAAKRGARAHGIEYNPDLVALSKRNAEAEGVADRATFEQADIFASDFSKATVVTLFLLEDLNRKLRPTLLEMKPGTRVVSNSFSMGDWTPDQQIDAGPTCQSFCRAFKWTIPAKVAGSWRLGDGELKLTQTYQMLAGTLTQGGRSLTISNAKMNGSEITFSVGGRRYSGEIADGKIIGKTDDGREWSATR